MNLEQRTKLSSQAVGFTANLEMVTMQEKEAGLARRGTPGVKPQCLAGGQSPVQRVKIRRRDEIGLGAPRAGPIRRTDHGQGARQVEGQ
jgi:hypothetical protein